MAAANNDSAHMIDPSRRLVPSTVPEDHPIHDAAEAGELARVRAFLDQQPSLVDDINKGFVNASGNTVYMPRRHRRSETTRGAWRFPRSVRLGVEGRGRRGHADRDRTTRDGTRRVRGVFTAVVTCGRRKLMRRLLDAGFGVHPQAGGCHAYLLERPDMLRELLTRGGLDPNDPTVDGVTLLHELCHQDSRGRTMDHRTECAAILLEFGADPSPKDAHGRDARNVGDEARAYGHRGFAESPRRNLDTRSVAVTENAAYRTSARNSR
jgi:hypothetical protein